MGWLLCGELSTDSELFVVGRDLKLPSGNEFTIVVLLKFGQICLLIPEAITGQSSIPRFSFICESVFNLLLMIFS